MAHILLGWEIGEGLHHVRTLLEVARALRNDGHVPTLALQNLQEPWPLLGQTGLAVVQAPFWHGRRRSGEPTFLAGSFADVLAVRGYDRVESLQPVVEGWQRLIDLVKPALIVADYAPTLCLAAHGVVPIVQVGSWFEMPPVEGPWFPALVQDQAPTLPQQKVFDVIREVQRRRGRPEPKTLTAFLAGDRFLTLVPELDPFRHARREVHWDPLESLPEPSPPPVERRFFAYLTAECAQAEPILTALALTGCPGKVYLRSLGHELAARLGLQGLTVLDEPAPLAAMVKEASVLVHHGGVGSAQTALAVGRPQLVFAQHLEQSVNGVHLQNLGVAISVPADAPPQTIGRALARALDDKMMAEHVATWSRTLHDRPRRPALEAIVKCCLAHLSSHG